jgi:hypothetical protein
VNRHLTDVELIDCVDSQALSLQHREHLERCGECGLRLEALRTTLARAKGEQLTEVPEPPPFFWEQFSRRVGDAIDREPASRWWTPLPVWAPTAAALVLVVAAFVAWNQARSGGAPTPASAVVEGPAAPNPLDEPLNLEDDVEWALVRIAADDLEWDAAADAGIGAKPGSADREALEMSAAERHELKRLIEAEMKQTGA